MTLYARSLTAAVSFLVGVLVSEAVHVGGALYVDVMKWRAER